MNWEAIGAIGEIVGAMAVVITLVYLALQTRHSAAATQSSTEVEASRQLSAWVTRSFQDELIQGIWDDVQAGKPLSDEHYRKWLWYLSDLFHMSEGIFIQYQKGFVSAEVWGRFESTILGMLQNTPGQEFWHSGNTPFSDAFKIHIEKLLASEPEWKMPNVAATKK